MNETLIRVEGAMSVKRLGLLLGVALAFMETVVSFCLDWCLVSAAFLSLTIFSNFLD